MYLKEKIQKELLKDYKFKSLLNDYKESYFPPKDKIFQSFELISNIKVLILGQDPYHGYDQANGLAFSVNKGIKIPPSLRNIFKELNNEYGYDMPQHGDLSSWSKQGVLLLNSILTVESNKPSSHKKLGWEDFTNNIIKHISDNEKNIVFLLWGNFAKSKEDLINKDKHLILKSTHPSPFSANKGFLGCDHFKKCNEYLEEKNINPIDWEIK